MYYEINNIPYEVEIIRKNNKNSYIRVNEELKIQITTNYFTSNHSLLKMLKENEKTIVKMIEKQQKKIEHQEKFWYLGKSYDIIEMIPSVEVEIENGKIYIPSQKKFTLWLKKELMRIFKERLDIQYHRFEEKIPYPKLKIRSMKTRWGVCNRKDNSITLNSQLLEYTYEEIDYVIIHELSHFVHFNHSTDFWKTVEKYCPNYKKARKKLKEV